MNERTQSKQLYQRMKRVIPGGVNSPVRRLGVDQTPMMIDRGEWDSIVDVDGNRYIDFCCSWGALIHGHAHPSIIENVQERMKKGTSFGMSCEVEARLAEKVVSLVPSVDLVRFVCSGTEATMSAVRLARGVTGKDLIVKFAGNYHGHADAFLTQAGSGVLNLSQTSSSAGIPPGMVAHTLTLEYNNVDAVREAFAHPDYGPRIAGVILEPVAGNMGVIPADLSFLTALREETEKNNALLIFDEVITGFRIARAGAQEWFGVVPDLICFGKVVGGGFPVAAFGGKKAIMEGLAPLGSVYQAGTLAGNPLAMEAGYQALTLLEEDGFYHAMEAKTKVVTDPIRQCIEQRGLDACIQEVGSMFTLSFGKRKVGNWHDVRALDGDRYHDLFSYLFERGIYFAPLQQEACFVSAAHTVEHLEQTAQAVCSFLGKVESKELQAVH